MAKRQTVDCAKIKEEANKMFLNSVDEFKTQREGVFLFAQSLLMGAGQYDGFGYLYEHHMDKSTQGKSVGIIRDETGNGNHTYPDPSRVFFF